MIALINTVREEIEQFSISDKQSLENFRIRFLGSKGQTKVLFGELKSVPNEQKKEIGQLLNDLRKIAESKYESFNEALESNEGDQQKIDLSRPGSYEETGARHPLSLVRREIIEIFSRIGYTVSEGPEIEDDWHNFSALNFPPEHPARDMQDTFFIEKGETEMAKAAVKENLFETYSFIGANYATTDKVKAIENFKKAAEIKISAAFK